MSREKQIAELISDITEVQNGGWEFVGDSEYTTDVHNEELAEALYDAGYRKQSVGEWLEIDDGVLIGDGKHLECSECGVWKKDRQRSNFCSHCGAKMKGGAE